VIGIGVGNLLNAFVSQKTNSIWPGLFTALLWGTWTISATTAVIQYVFW
ncbi:MAG TPA: hypothetical protein IAC36_04950, partial [Candidatus Aphodomonas merdavium]|nr:hypothetical protein [Candidatus Aphodomonas merdavium]